MYTSPWWNLWNTWLLWSAAQPFKWFLHLREFLFFSLLLFLYCQLDSAHSDMRWPSSATCICFSKKSCAYIHVSCSIYNLNSRDRTVARQLNFNHRVVKVQTQNESAVKWVVLVKCVFLLCYGIFLRCSLLFLAGHKCGNDFYYKITLQVVNSGINSKVYAFFKWDIKKE